LIDFLKNPQTSEFHENYPVGAELFLVDRQAGRQAGRQIRESL